MKKIKDKREKTKNSARVCVRLVFFSSFIFQTAKKAQAECTPSVFLALNILKLVAFVFVASDIHWDFWFSFDRYLAYLITVSLYRCEIVAVLNSIKS